MRYWTFGFYVDDQWNVTPRLTLNMGLRYSPTTKIKNVRHQLFVLKNPPYGLWEKSDYLWAKNPSLYNLDPRLGLAWDPLGDQRTSIRAGFAIFHSPILGRDNFAWYQPPLLQSTQTAAQGLVYPFPYSNVPIGSGLVIPMDGTLTL